jgi:hypothetical protein
LRGDLVVAEPTAALAREAMTHGDVMSHDHRGCRLPKVQQIVVDFAAEIVCCASVATNLRPRHLHRGFSKATMIRT